MRARRDSGGEPEPAADVQNALVAAGIGDREQEERDREQKNVPAMAPVVRIEATNIYVVKMAQLYR